MISHYKLLTLLTRKTSVTLNIPEQIVDEVVTFQWKRAQEATKVSNTVELSGFGKFMIRPNIIKAKLRMYSCAKKKLEKSLSEMTNESKNWYRDHKLLTRFNDYLNYLSQKNGI